jgi:hypothetical protein
MSNEQIYLYRRKGLSDYATCDRVRYVELSQHKLFETMVCYASPEPEEGDHEGRQLEWERAENNRLKTMADNYCALLMDANAKLAERDALFADVLSIDVPRTAKALEQMRAILSANSEPPAPAAVECTSCDGSGEYIDAIGDWRGYCSCPAGVALKNRPANKECAP